MNQVWSRNQETGELKPAKSLMAALGFEKKEQLPRIISLVGGGGKTTTIYQLADELSEQGLRVLINQHAYSMSGKRTFCLCGSCQRSDS